MGSHASRRSLALAALPLVLLVLAATAQGSENYPGIIERRTGVECPRPLTRCLICHDTAAGGEETANKPFADTLRSLGLSGGKATRELDLALQALPADKDTDLDGTPDREELEACMNPSGGELSEGPGYGCNGARLARAEPVLERTWAIGCALGVLVLLRRRRVRGRGLEHAGLILACIALDGLPGCSPTDILEESFPAKVRTCYEFPAAADAGVARQSSFYGGVTRPEGCEPAAAGAGGSGAGTSSAGSSSGGASSGGSGGSSGGMSAAGGLGGTGSDAPGGAAGSNAPPGDAGGIDPGGPPPDGQGGTGPSVPVLSDACRALAAARAFADLASDTSVMLQLFQAPFAVGGCQDPENGECHEPGGNQPNLRDGDVVARLLDAKTDPIPEEYKCAALLPEERIWITRGAGIEGSLIWRKVNSAPPDAPFLELGAPPCGDSMPAFPGEPSRLSESDRQCIAGWINQVSASGGP
jgi:hypothetical protein